jgi:hypothetical protein
MTFDLFNELEEATGREYLLGPCVIGGVGNKPTLNGSRFDFFCLVPENLALNRFYLEIPVSHIKGNFRLTSQKFSQPFSTSGLNPALEASSSIQTKDVEVKKQSWTLLNLNPNKKTELVFYSKELSKQEILYFNNEESVSQQFCVRNFFLREQPVGWNSPSDEEPIDDSPGVPLVNPGEVPTKERGLKQVRSLFKKMKEAFVKKTSIISPTPINNALNYSLKHLLNLIWVFFLESELFLAISSPVWQRFRDFLMEENLLELDPKSLLDVNKN